MKTQVVVDRVEEHLAVLEVGELMIDWPLASLPSGVKEGTRLAVSFEILPSNPDELEARLERLRARGPRGDDIDL